ncbi:hypothetical protein [Helicobacter ailurogastricus]|uniref:hypothetical protein n=1 Tax=Helicobacter ailurogastricus TaxID=1578720 RepID=UPI000CF125CC|nr:hypothetical protein [Helicobacter ailurogastricus]GLH58463.1 hypothetical protein NHP214376_12540 [Helicobacter ailurogastricus]GLH59967.1 hypothetical protein NHP214377_12380 [Helicobacter ailurogastricus]GMB90258.1 hypothetical protein NHP190002_09450 [Helicobacter ailurogastricus]
MWRWVFLIGLFCGCNSVFSPFSLNLSYPLSPSKPNPALKPLFLSPPDVVFNAEFVPAYDQAQFTKALQKATIGILQHLGYPLSPQGYNTNLQAQIGLAFKNTPKDLKDIAKMLKESHNDSLDPARVLQMLEAKSDLTLRLCAKDTPKCLSHISVQIKQPILRANPLDSDPNERSGPNANYNHALNLALNKLFTKSMQALQNDLAGGQTFILNQ